MDTLHGVVVGGVDYGDNDRIVKLLTADHGRVAVMARRAGTRFRGVLDVGLRVRMDLRRGRGRLLLVSEVTVEAMPKRARADLVRIGQLNYGCELCAALAPEDHPVHKLYRLLCAWLDVLEAEAAPGLATRQALEAKALTFSGLTPALVGCAVCGERLSEPTVWDPAVGGGLHGRCGHGAPSHPDWLVRLEALRRTALADTVGVRASEAGWLLSDFVEYNLGSGLKSRKFLDDVEGFMA